MKQAIDLSYASEFNCKFRKCVVQLIELLSGRRELYKRYRQHIEHAEIESSGDFWGKLLRGLAVWPRYDVGKLENMPRSGPLVVVANHPFGVLDGIIISHIVSQVRPDYKVMTTSVLDIAPHIKDVLIPIYFDEKGQPTADNLPARKAALDFLKKGGCIVVFPAGGVSTAPRPFTKRAVDHEWQPFIAKMIQRSQATVFPLFFHGQNSRLFHVVSHISVTLRQSLFLRELVKKIDSIVNVSIGEPISFAELAHFEDREALCSELKRRTYALGGVSL